MSRGRGRISSIDRLPEAAADDIVWVNQQLYQRTRDGQDILAEFNERLAAKGLGPISPAAFSRKSTRLAAAQRRMQEARAMFAGLSDEFTAGDVDDNTLILGEFIKALIQELVDDQAGMKSPKEAMELAKAYQATVSAQKMSSDRRLKLEAELQDKTDAAVEKVAQAATEAGLSAAVIEQLRRDFLGVRPKKADEPAGKAASK